MTRMIFRNVEKVMLLAGLLLLLILTACANNDGPSGGVNCLSTSSDHECFLSHAQTDARHGSNCLESACHGPAADSSRPHFTVAGTVFQTVSSTSPLANVDLELLSGGNVVSTLPVDGNGNFFTTSSITYDDARVKNGTTLSTTMSNATTDVITGACNLSGCHATSRINPN